MRIRYGIGVTSRGRVLREAEEGFAQLCHGKERPLQRMQPCDWLVSSSPRTERQRGEPVQAFTALDRVVDDGVHRYAVGAGFAPYRTNVAYVPCREAPIRPLLERLAFVGDARRWDFPFRAGHLEIGRDDVCVIAAATGPGPDREDGGARGRLPDLPLRGTPGEPRLPAVAGH